METFYRGGREMKVDYEELMQYYEAARNKTPGEWKDAIEAILDAVPDIVKERKAIEAENADLRQRVMDYSTEIVALLSQKHDMEKRINSLEHDLMFLEARHSQDNLKTRLTQLPPYGWNKGCRS
jgi:uncharacterized protein YhaN